jgi:acyl-CoA thioesterase
VFIGMQAEIRYMTAARDDCLTATATRVGGSKKFAHYQVVVTDGPGNCIALFTSSAYKLGA